MSVVEHPELGAFEPQLSRLMGIALKSGIWELEKKGYRLPDIKHNRSTMNTFLRGCHYGFDLAQRQIAGIVIGIERTISEQTLILKDLRRSGNRDAKDVLNKIEILRYREVILRRLVDSMLYTIIAGKNWLLRRFTIDMQIHSIDPVVLQRTVEEAVDRNRGDRMKFNLVSDLTTVVQIGDLIEIDATAQDERKWKVVELKEGKINRVLAEFIEDRGAPLSESDFDSLKNLVGKKAPKQAKRMLRQKARMRELTRIVDTDRGLDPALNIETYMTPDSVELQNYCAKVERVYEIAKQTGVGALIVDHCLRTFAISQQKANGSAMGHARHVFFHMAHPEQCCSLAMGQNSSKQNEELKMLEAVPYFVDLTAYNMMVPTAEPIFAMFENEVNCPRFCTTVRERVYITASGCESGLGASRGL